MKNKSLVITSGILLILWGSGHLFPTKNIVSDFGNISSDNRYIILMEWINEGLTLIFIGSLILAVSLVKSQEKRIKKTVYIVSAIMLISMAVLSLLTGFKVDFLPFKLCPFIFTISAIPLLMSALKK
jgi:hypothetical protein